MFENNQDYSQITKSFPSIINKGVVWTDRLRIGNRLFTDVMCVSYSLHDCPKSQIMRNVSKTGKGVKHRQR